MTGLLWQPNERTSTTPTNLNQVYNPRLHTDPKPSPTAWPFQAAWLITSEFFCLFFKEKKKQWGPNRNPYLLFQNWSTVKYTVQLRNGGYGRPANSLQTSAMHFSAQPQLPHKPIVLEKTSMAATLARTPLLFFVVWQRGAERSEV